MGVSGVGGPPPQYPSNVPTPSESQAGKDLFLISQAIDRMTNALNNPNLSPAQQLVAVTKEMNTIKELNTDLNSVPTSGLSKNEVQELNTLEGGITGILWNAPEFYVDTPGHYLDVLGKVSGEAFMLSQFMLLGSSSKS